MSRLEQIEAVRQKKYIPFRTALDSVEHIFHYPPQNWWFSGMLMLNRVQRHMQMSPDNYPVEMRSFVEDYLSQIYQLLKDEALQPFAIDSDSFYPDKQKHIATGAKHLFHKVSDCLMADEPIEHQKREIFTLGLEDLCMISPRLKMAQQFVNGTQQSFICVYSQNKNNWFEYPIPLTDKVLHKGGIGRTLLKIIYGAASDTIEAELPPNDFDYIVIKDDEGITDATSLNADPNGIEYVHTFDFQTLMDNRDLTMNNAFLGKNGLIFCQEAVDAAKTGKIATVSTKRGIYGSEVFYFEGVRMLKNRGIMRLVKSVAEGKALSFDFIPLNTQINLGIYWLVLAKRFSNKSNFPLLLDRMLEIGKRMDQVPADASNVFDVLDTMHQKYPFFDFNAGSLDEIGDARWIGRKLIKQIDKKYRDKYGIPSMLELHRQPNDTLPFEVNLDGYNPDPEKLQFIAREWGSFIERCSVRTASFKLLQRNGNGIKVVNDETGNALDDTNDLEDNDIQNDEDE